MNIIIQLYNKKKTNNKQIIKHHVNLFLFKNKVYQIKLYSSKDFFVPSNKTEPKIKIIPIIFKTETSSFQRKKPSKVATSGSTVTKIAAIPVSNPLNESV